MASNPRDNVVIIGCGVLNDEVAALRDKYWPECETLFLTSMLHMHPEVLGSTLQSALDECATRGKNAALVYGDCCSRMATFDTIPGVARTRVKNCCEILLGTDEYRRLSHEGAFFMLPEWTRRWKEIFTKELGLTRINAASIMQDMHKKLVYLDCGITPIPLNELEECSEFCGLPYEILPVSLDKLRASIEDALSRAHSAKGAE